MTITPPATMSKAPLEEALQVQEQLLQARDRHKKLGLLPDSIEDWPPEYRRAYEAIAKDMQSVDRIPKHMAKKDAEDYVRLVYGIQRVKKWIKETQ